MIPLYFFVPVMQYLNHLEQILLANNCYIYFGVQYSKYAVPPFTPTYFLHGANTERSPHEKL